MAHILLLPGWVRVYQPRRACDIVTLPPLGMILNDAPPLERGQSLEQELAELRGQIAAHRNELVIMVVNKAAGIGWSGRSGSGRGGWWRCGRGWR